MAPPRRPHPRPHAHPHPLAPPAGAELVNSYGEHSSAELLRGYGFVEAANPHGGAQLPLGLLIKGAAGLLPGQPGPGAAPEAGDLWGRPFSGQQLDEVDACSEYSVLGSDDEGEGRRGGGLAGRRRGAD